MTKSLMGAVWGLYSVVCEACGRGGLTAAGGRRRESPRLQAAELFEQKARWRASARCCDLGHCMTADSVCAALNKPVAGHERCRGGELSLFQVNVPAPAM